MKVTNPLSNKLLKIFLQINTNFLIPINNAQFAYNNLFIKKLLEDYHACIIFIKNAVMNGFIDHWIVQSVDKTFIEYVYVKKIILSI